MFEKNPLKILDIFDQGLIEAQRSFLANSALDQQVISTSLSFKPNAHVRLIHLPICYDLHRYLVPRSKEVGCLISMSGTIVRSSEIKMEERFKEYECQKCFGTFKVFAEDSILNEIPKPTICSFEPPKHPESQQIPRVSCTGNAFNLIKPRTQHNLFKSVQEIRLQEHISKLPMGKVSMDALLYHWFYSCKFSRRCLDG